MATLTLIAEPFADLDAAAHAEAALDLTEAVAFTAPRGCSARLLVAADRDTPEFATARARTERLPLTANALPLLWRTGMSARPLDGELVHALTPLAALRSRVDDDGSQTSVMVPHALGWLAPDAMGAASARQYRAFVKRAVRLADAVVTPTHAVATALRERFGNIDVQVLPLAAPSSYLRPADDAERRAALGLPEQYLATTAAPGENGRLEWLLAALEADPSLPPLVVLTDRSSRDAASVAAPAGASVPADAPEPAAAPGPQTSASEPAVALLDSLRHRVHLVQPREPADIGAVLSGAQLLVMPQQHIGAGYVVLGALASGVPVVHAGCDAVAELALDAGIDATAAADGRDGFASELSRVTRDEAELARLRVLADDRSRTFSWGATAAMLWELHANI